MATSTASTEPLVSPRAIAAGAPRRGLGRDFEHALGRDWAAAWLFYLPTFILLFGLIGYPFFQGIYIGFTKTLGSTNTIGPWVGLQNYTRLIQDRDFRLALGVTIKYVVLAEIFKPLLGVIGALLIHNFTRARSVLSAVILLPYIVPAIIRGLIWRALYDPIFGGFNEIAHLLHLTSKNVVWLGDPKTALYALVVVNVWAGIPFFTLINLAGLKSIDSEQYDAAAVDGANAWHRFRYITLPGLQYTLVVSVLISTIFTMSNFQDIYFLTQGGPLNATRVIGILTYERGFNQRDFGQGVATALIMLPLVGLVIWIMSSYIRAGQGVGSAAPIQLRVFRIVLWPVRMLFTLLFDAIEWVVTGLSVVTRRLLGRGEGESALGRRTGWWTLRVFALALLAALVLFELLPFYWVIVSAFKSDQQNASIRSIFWPQPWTLAQFEHLLQRTKFLDWYRNTVVVAVASVAIGVLAATTGAYALARLRWRGASFFSTLMLITYMLPSIVLLIPLYRIMLSLHLNNTLTGLIVSYPSGILPLATWFLVGYYRSIPEELEEAARIDGASRWQVFWSIILPLARPAIMAVTLLALTAAWNEFFLAYVLIRSSYNFTLAIGLFQMAVGDVFPIGQMMAASLLTSIPVIIFYGYAQRHLVEGLTVGGVKG